MRFPLPNMAYWKTFEVFFFKQFVFVKFKELCWIGLRFFVVSVDILQMFHLIPHLFFTFRKSHGFERQFNETWVRSNVNKGRKLNFFGTGHEEEVACGVRTIAHVQKLLLFDPHGRLVWSLFYIACFVHPFILTFQEKSNKSNKFWLQIMITTGGKVVLAKWIIDVPFPVLNLYSTRLRSSLFFAQSSKNQISRSSKTIFLSHQLLVRGVDVNKRTVTSHSYSLQ